MLQNLRGLLSNLLDSFRPTVFQQNAVYKLDKSVLAVNPLNAILNYRYAILESESRLAAAALGLDPGIGVLHVDTEARDSLVRLMEAVRPDVDAFLVDWITRETLKREWFFEQRNGNLSFEGIACNSALRNRSDMESRPCTRCGADIRAGRHRPHP